MARILGDGRRRRTQVFTELQSHYLFTDRFVRPGKGNDKGSVEGMVGYGRRNFLAPIPSFESFFALEARAEAASERAVDRESKLDGDLFAGTYEEIAMDYSNQLQIHEQIPFTCSLHIGSVYREKETESKIN